jgi:hypothetical protein
MGAGTSVPRAEPRPGEKASETIARQKKEIVDKGLDAAEVLAVANLPDAELELMQISQLCPAFNEGLLQVRSSSSVPLRDRCLTRCCVGNRSARTKSCGAAKSIVLAATTRRGIRRLQNG